MSVYQIATSAGPTGEYIVNSSDPMSIAKRIHGEDVFLREVTGYQVPEIFCDCIMDITTLQQFKVPITIKLSNIGGQ